MPIQTTFDVLNSKQDVGPSHHHRLSFAQHLIFSNYNLYIWTTWTQKLQELVNELSFECIDLDEIKCMITDIAEPSSDSWIIVEKLQEPVNELSFECIDQDEIKHMITADIVEASSDSWITIERRRSF